jgi:hypothetical protein
MLSLILVARCEVLTKCTLKITLFKKNTELKSKLKTEKTLLYKEKKTSNKKYLSYRIKVNLRSHRILTKDKIINLKNNKPLFNFRFFTLINI